MAKVVAGNWKMHHGPGRTREFFGSFRPDVDGEGRPEVLVFPPAVSLAAAVEAAGGSVAIGAQNVHWEAEGAFTGEISVSMVAEIGATHVLVGHSERRHVFGESDEAVTRKIRSVLGGDLVPVVCVGETLDERRAGRLEEVLLRQLDAALDGWADDGRMLIAYEPVWAIGTGETATPRDASDAHGILRSRLTAARGASRAATVPILYGGSVKPGNALELMSAPDVDGVLVGGASLDPASFARIVEAGAEAAGGAERD